MEIGLKSLIGFSVSILTILILQATFIILYLRSEINHTNLEIHCDDGWEPYKQEKCLKLFDTVGLWSYANAENFCKEQNDSFLISINGAEKQEFVQTFLRSHSVVDKVWIGLKYENNILQWADGTQLRYSNWANGSPKNDIISYCFQMETEDKNFGLWSDESCWEKNLIVCERFQHWYLAQLQIKMMNLIRNSVQQRSVYDAQFSNSTNSIHYLNSTLTQVQTSLNSSISSLTNSIQRLNLTQTQSQTDQVQIIRSHILPVGFIYVQLPKEKSPAETWPWMKWEDISLEYAGLFFRTVGGNAAPFGEVQNPDSPRLMSLKKAQSVENQYEVNVTANNHYSPVLDLDILTEINTNHWGFAVKLSNAEVRPVNMAIKIWKRIA